MISIRFPWVFIYFFTLGSLAFFLFTTFVYAKIYLVARKLARSERRPDDFGERQRHRRKGLLQEIKHAKSCFLVVLSFAVCLLPAVVDQLFVDLENPYYPAMVTWRITMLNLNSSVNSLVFFWSKKVLRNEATAILTSLFSG